jgi:hypothetical protein
MKFELLNIKPNLQYVKALNFHSIFIIIKIFNSNNSPLFRVILVKKPNGSKFYIEKNIFYILNLGF